MTAAPHPADPATGRGAEPTVHLDLTGVVCPLTWVRTRLALERMRPGEALAVCLDAGEPLESVPEAAREDGYLVEVEGSLVTIVKR